MMFGDSNINSLPVWIGTIRLISELVIMLSTTAIAAMLFGSKGRGAAVSWALGVLVLGVALCTLQGISCLLDAWQTATEAASSSTAAVELPVWRVLAASFWGLTALRLPAILRRSFTCESVFYRRYHLDGHACQADIRQPKELANETARLGLKAKMLKILIRNESWLIDKFDVRQEPDGVIDDMEMFQCKI